MGNPGDGPPKAVAFAGFPRTLRDMEYDWSSLDELRTTYLEGTAGQGDYWASDELLRGYDVTFARRIAWKWHHVFGDLAGVSWTPPAGATRGFLAAIPDRVDGGGSA